MPANGEVTGGGRILVWSGLGVTALGFLASRFFSPSPHGYLELFIALPLIAGGVLMTGLGLIAGSRNRVSRAAGWLLVGATGAVLGTFLYVLLFLGR